MTIRRRLPKARDSHTTNRMPMRTVQRAARDRQAPRKSSTFRARRGWSTATNSESWLFPYLQGLVPALAVSGLLVYTQLTVQYERFYGSLGIKPADVGLSYAGVLASSTGYILFQIITLLMACVGGFFITSLILSVSRRHWKPTEVGADVRLLFA